MYNFYNNIDLLMEFRQIKEVGRYKICIVNNKCLTEIQIIKYYNLGYLPAYIRQICIPLPKTGAYKLGVWKINPHES